MPTKARLRALLRRRTFGTRRKYRRSTRTFRRSRRSRFRTRGRLPKTSKRTFMSPKQVFPDRGNFKLGYSDVQGLQSSGTTSGFYSFSGNDPYSPDPAGASVGQPYMWDQLTPIYNIYRCYGSKISVTFYPYSATAGDEGADTVQGCVVVPVRTTVTNFTPSLYNPIDLDQLPYSRSKTLDITGTGNRSQTIKHFMSNAKLYGMTKLEANTDSEFEGILADNPSGSSPTKDWYWHVYAFPLDSTAVGRCFIRVRITYYISAYSRLLHLSS